MQDNASNEIQGLLDLAAQLFAAKKYNQTIAVLLVVKKKKSEYLKDDPNVLIQFNEMVDDLIKGANDAVLEQDGSYDTLKKKKGKK
jgi:hypothetical protein